MNHQLKHWDSILEELPKANTIPLSPKRELFDVGSFHGYYPFDGIYRIDGEEGLFLGGTMIPFEEVKERSDEIDTILDRVRKSKKLNLKLFIDHVIVKQELRRDYAIKYMSVYSQTIAPVTSLDSVWWDMETDHFNIYLPSIDIAFRMIKNADDGLQLFIIYSSKKGHIVGFNKPHYKGRQVALILKQIMLYYLDQPKTI